jgi:4-oxalmesaconate hydratase
VAQSPTTGAATEASPKTWASHPSKRCSRTYFDTCVYHQRGIDLLVDVIGADNVLFASEMIGAVRGIDQNSGRYFDDTKPYVDGVPGITEADKQKIFQDNALKVYPRLKQYLKV